jgi:hypothetical protein
MRDGTGGGTEGTDRVINLKIGVTNSKAAVRRTQKINLRTMGEKGADYE